MPLSAGHNAAVQRIVAALEANRDDPQGENNIVRISEAIVDAIELDLIPQGNVTGQTTTYYGLQDLQNGKVN